MSVLLTGIRGVVFDLDDTLYPEWQYAESGLTAAGAWLATQIPCPGDPAARLIEMFRAGRRGRLFDDLLAEWGQARAAELIPQMVACYRNHPPAIRLHADARRAIERWTGRFRLGLITDGTLVCQRRKIEALGLRSYLDPLLCTDQWGEAYGKPHPRAFAAIEQAWGLPGESCVYIADNPSKDFVSPNARGWHSVRVLRPDGQYLHALTADGGEPQACVRSMDEVDIRS